MKITDVRAITLSCPLDKPVETSFGKMHERTNMLIFIDTDEGLTGIGETWVNYPQWAVDERAITIHKGLKPLLMGEDPTNIALFWKRVYSNILKSGAGLQYGSVGPLYQAISGVDIALWDILGKKLQVPIYKLLGGKLCSKIRAYASGLSESNYEQCIDKSLKKGYSAFKLKVGFGKESDLRTIKAVRDLIGSGSTLMADANQGWEDASEAMDNIRRLAEFQIEFIEEPVPANRLQDLKKIRDSGITAVAGGENLYARYGFIDSLTSEVLSIVQPDVTKTGGISEARIICQMAQAWQLPFAPHMFGSAVGLAASLHLLASIPNGLYMEVDASHNPLMTDLLKEAFFTFENGYFMLAVDKPGLGIELNIDFVKEYQRT